MNDKQVKPECRIGGMVAPNGICGHIIVGMKHCGFKGYCQYKDDSPVLLGAVEEENSNEH